MAINRSKVKEIVEVTTQELKSLGYDDTTIGLMELLMISILHHVSLALGDMTYHKNTAQTFRSLANIIELMIENRNVN